MTSREIRQSFLEFFRSKQHTIVPSSSLMPDAPNLLFTNAGMNQFVPIFLGQQRCPYHPPRAADTQKCIRAGGKHNDLEDVGFDTYHHTFFEMLGNWSFGDYFKKEAIAWAWELVTGVWQFPKHRLYATVYAPNRAQGDPSDFDQEAYDLWAGLFQAAGLDPKQHIVHGGKKDNFWMMGETGPCGPCSEIHVDLTADGDTGGKLVNGGRPDCIEIWNLVFIQYNANADGTFSPLPARHVDTGMGFERVTAIMQGTQQFRHFSAVISNYETDIFRPLFARLEALSGLRYQSTIPSANPNPAEIRTQQVDVAFRVIADHIRTLSFAIADGIRPGNTDRQYVLRRILRRAVRYGRVLGLHQPFFHQLVAVLAETMGEVFPEIRAKQADVEAVIRTEEESFNKTLDHGIELFRAEVETVRPPGGASPSATTSKTAGAPALELSGEFAFKLYDTYGFPLDLTELMAREVGLSVDTVGFNALMEQQRARGRASQKKEVITVSQISEAPTRFIGYDEGASASVVLQLVPVKDRVAVILDQTPFYAEMGGQVGDTGALQSAGQAGASVAEWRIANTVKQGDTFLHVLAAGSAPERGTPVRAQVDLNRRRAIERHHTVTHLLHWALHEIVGSAATQKGSYVGPEKLTFDFNSAPLTGDQVNAVEKLVNERIVENSGVSWTSLPYGEAKRRADILQFFGDKYGDSVRVVQIGGEKGALNGYSMELCGGTHTRATGELGLFRITGESAIAAGIRRIEALAGSSAWEKARRESEMLGAVAQKLSVPVAELERKVEALLLHQKELEKQLLKQQAREARELARQLVGSSAKLAAPGIPHLVANLGAIEGGAEMVQHVAEALRAEFDGVVVLGAVANEAVTLVATVSPGYHAKIHAGKLMQHIAPLVEGKGGGRPEQARGGGKNAGQLDAALAAAAAFVKTHSL